VGVLGGAEKLSDVAAREGRKCKEFGYIDTSEPKPLIRLACQAQAYGAVPDTNWRALYAPIRAKQYIRAFGYLKTVLSQLPAADSVEEMEALVPWASTTG
jgi:hypothetical protein